MKQRISEMSFDLMAFIRISFCELSNLQHYLIIFYFLLSNKKLKEYRAVLDESMNSKKQSKSSKLIPELKL